MARRRPWLGGTHESRSPWTTSRGTPRAAKRRHGVHRAQAGGVDARQGPGHGQRPRGEPPREAAQPGHLLRQHLPQLGVGAVRGDGAHPRLLRGEEQARGRAHGVPHDVHPVRRQPPPGQEVDRAAGVPHLAPAQGVARPAGGPVAPQVEDQHPVAAAGQGGGDLQEAPLQLVLAVAAAAVHQHHRAPGSTRGHLRRGRLAASPFRVPGQRDGGDEPARQGEGVDPAGEGHFLIDQPVVRREAVRCPALRPGDAVRHDDADGRVGQREAEGEGAGRGRRSTPAPRRTARLREPVERAPRRPDRITARPNGGDIGNGLNHALSPPCPGLPPG